LLSILRILITLIVLVFLKKSLKNIILLNLLILILTFCFRKFLLFFIGFEISLIPMFFIILGWGSTPERLTARSYLLIYTLIFSIPFLILLIIFQNQQENLSFGTYQHVLNLSVYLSIDWIMFLWILCFLVKVPMYGLHLWLAKAHVEAPVFGSILLAAILLKLGLYGIIRSFLFWKFKLLKIKNFFVIYLFFGLIISGFICFRQIDIKSLIAYSSVQHMMLSLIGLRTFSSLNYLGVLLIAIFHGFISSALFFGFKMIYNLSKTRNILLNFGILKIFPIFVFFWFFALALKSSVPPSGNFISEIFLIFCVKEFWTWGFPFLILGVVLSGLFSIFVYTVMSHGKKNALLTKFSNLEIKKINLLKFQIIIPIFGIFFFVKLI